MSYLRVVLIVGLLMASLAAATGGASPAVGLRENFGGSCGVKLVLKNPDLQEQPDGFIHASGWFFIQFQAVGPGAERVKSFAFSFGKPLPDGAPKCDAAAGRHLTGAYVFNYRGDYTPEDGFFVPINTTLVRDDEYGAAVHAYDQPNAQGNEVGRFYAKAKVTNGCQQMQCRDRTPADILKQDKVMPWPRILPGDGIQTNGVEGLTVEFAEGVREVRAFINGNETPLTPWEGVPMDDDLQPGNDNTPCGSQPSQVCTKRVWGPAYKWEGVIEQNDVIRVTAVDLNNNRVEKILHLLDPTQGGIVTGEQVDLSVTVENSTLRTGPQQAVEFRFQFISLSSTEAHVNLALGEYPEGALEAKWDPPHVVVRAGERASAGLIVSGKPGTNSGTFDMKAIASWRSGGQDVVREVPITFIIGSGQGARGGAPSATLNETAGANAAAGDTPGLGIVAAVGAVMVVAGVRWRRR